MRLVFAITLLVGIDVALADTITTFVDGYDQAKIDKMKKQGKGMWTEWMNRDFPFVGEYEFPLQQHLYDAKLTKHKMLCPDPKALMYAPANEEYDLEAINKCTIGYSDDPRTGYRCDNYKQVLDDDTGGMRQYSDECKKICTKYDLDRIDVPCGQCPNIKVKFFCEGTEQNFENYMNAAKRDLEAFETWQKRQMKRVLLEEEQEVQQQEEGQEQDLRMLLQKLVRKLQEQN